jgi:DNA-directed RNA polymerase specialized sigma24 family protein
MFTPRATSEPLPDLYARLLKRAVVITGALSPRIAKPEPADLVQETLYRFFSSQTALGFDEARATRYTFLVGVMRNVLREQQRRGRRTAGSVSDDDFIKTHERDPQFQSDPWPETERRMASERASALEGWTPLDVAFVNVARRVGGPRPISEIARELGVSYAVARAVQKRVRRRCKGLL